MSNEFPPEFPKKTKKKGFFLKNFPVSGKNDPLMNSLSLIPAVCARPIDTDSRLQRLDGPDFSGWMDLTSAVGWT